MVYRSGDVNDENVFSQKLNMDDFLEGEVIKNPNVINDWVNSHICDRDVTQNIWKLTNYDVVEGIHILRISKKQNTPTSPSYKQQMRAIYDPVNSNKGFTILKKDLFYLADKIVAGLNREENSNSYPFDLCVQLNSSRFKYCVGIYHDHRKGKYFRTNYLCVPPYIDISNISLQKISGVLAKSSNPEYSEIENIAVFSLKYSPDNLPSRELKICGKLPYKYVIHVPRDQYTDSTHMAFRHVINSLKYSFGKPISESIDKIIQSYDLDRTFISEQISAYILAGYIRDSIFYDKYFVISIYPTHGSVERQKLLTVMQCLCDIYRSLSSKPKLTTSDKKESIFFDKKL